MTDTVFDGEGLIVWVEEGRLWFAPIITEHGEGRVTRDEVFRLRDSLQLWLEQTHQDSG